MLTGIKRHIELTLLALELTHTHNKKNQNWRFKRCCSEDFVLEFLASRCSFLSAENLDCAESKTIQQSLNLAISKD